MNYPLTHKELLQLLCEQIFNANRKQGFWDAPAEIAASYSQSPVWLVKMKKAEKIALIHSEASEALEGIRKDLPSDHLPGFTLEEEELADVLIRVFDYAGGFNLRLAEVVFAKLEFNAQRPFKHGKSF